MARRTPDARPSRMPPAERRRQILEAARRLLEFRPFDELSVESVAREAGVSPGLLFHYFGSQRTFRQAVLEAAADEVLAHVRPDPALSPAEQLRAGIATFTDHVTRYPAVYRAVTRLGAAAGVRTLHRSARATLAGWLHAALAASGAPATPAVTLAVSGWLACTEEMVLAWLDEPTTDRAALEELCERSFHQLIRAALDDEDQWLLLSERVTVRPAEPPAR
ncbi:TetR/AcrR family transcriptional regulator [Streptomyces genisteinicus]|uniref:TetR/AcrR family transcriptional regulator n=1 Tax=Streptomyces genisteinicus TaxID=2768068 RepID=A0A7H0HMH2_9ACTN|nr:TetR/AcrR family transcriptional regulator [Streptomyces genisteinicus]QNP61738.1 TetR/AcrR family transcriptional regulator [Streptomyces genisteinicus]